MWFTFQFCIVFLAGWIDCRDAYRNWRMLPWRAGHHLQLCVTTGADSWLQSGPSPLLWRFSVCTQWAGSEVHGMSGQIHGYAWFLQVSLQILIVRRCIYKMFNFTKIGNAKDWFTVLRRSLCQAVLEEKCKQNAE